MISSVAICGVGGTHDTDVETAFREACTNFSGTVTQLGAVSLQSAVDGGYEIIIRSTTGASGSLTLAQTAWLNNQAIFMPSGSNSFVRVINVGSALTAMFLTGAGDTANETGYDIEFFAPDTITVEPDLSSYSNGYIAGRIARIKIALNCTWWQARYRARKTGSRLGVWHETDGYGKINVESAIAYNGDIEDDPYTEGDQSVVVDNQGVISLPLSSRTANSRILHSRTYSRFVGRR